MLLLARHLRSGATLDSIRCFNQAHSCLALPRFKFHFIPFRISASCKQFAPLFSSSHIYLYFACFPTSLVTNFFGKLTFCSAGKLERYLKFKSSKWNVERDSVQADSAAEIQFQLIPFDPCSTQTNWLSVWVACNERRGQEERKTKASEGCRLESPYDTLSRLPRGHRHNIKLR